MKADFPFFSPPPGEPDIVYLDNAATTQKPRCVLEALQDFYCRTNANIHRGAHRTSRLATEAHEDARRTVAQFLHAASEKEVLFTSGCTEGINLVAQVLALSGRIGRGDEVLVSTDAHHSNIVPWQMLCERVGARLRAVPLAPDLSFDLAAYLGMLHEHTRVVAVPVVSNALGLRLPVEEITRAAKGAGALVLLDGAQTVAHEAVDVQALGCDFFAFSGHKVYAPTGTGAFEVGARGFGGFFALLQFRDVACAIVAGERGLDLAERERRNRGGPGSDPFDCEGDEAIGTGDGATGGGLWSDDDGEVPRLTG